MFRRLIMAIFRLYMKYLLSSYTKHTQEGVVWALYPLPILYKQPIMFCITFFNVCHPEVFNTYIRIYNDVSVKHNKTLLCLLLFWGYKFRFL